MNRSFASVSSAATHAPAAGAHLELPGLTAAYRDAVRERQRQQRAGVFGDDVVEIDAHIAAPGDVGGAVADAADVAPSARSWWSWPHDDAARAARGRRAARRPVPRSTSRSSSDGGDDAGQPALSASAAATTIRARRGCSGRASIARPAAVGRPAASSAPRRRSSSCACCMRARRWRIDEAQIAERGSPRGQLQGDAGQVDLGDLGLEVGPAGGVLELAPQPIGDARLGASGAARRAGRPMPGSC